MTETPSLSIYGLLIERVQQLPFASGGQADKAIGGKDWQEGKSRPFSDSLSYQSSKRKLKIK
jgi:hypothetical protein